MDDTPNQLGYRSSRCSIEELEREEGLERKKRILERDNAIVRIVIHLGTVIQRSTDKDGPRRRDSTVVSGQVTRVETSVAI